MMQKHSLQVLVYQYRSCPLCIWADLYASYQSLRTNEPSFRPGRVLSQTCGLCAPFGTYFSWLPLRQRSAPSVEDRKAVAPRRSTCSVTAVIGTETKRTIHTVVGTIYQLYMDISVQIVHGCPSNKTLSLGRWPPRLITFSLKPDRDCDNLDLVGR